MEAPAADLVEAFGEVVIVAADVVEVVCVVEAELEEGGGKCKVRTTRLVGRRAGLIWQRRKEMVRNILAATFVNHLLVGISTNYGCKRTKL